MNWRKSLIRGRVKQREPLKGYTTFRIGGPARYFIEPADIDDLKLLLGILKRGRINFLLLGAGSNLLVADRGVAKAVIHLGSPPFKAVRIRGNMLEAGAGALLGSVIAKAAQQGLSGLEFLTGIPGTVGGALAMNAGISEKPSPGRKPQVKGIFDTVKDVTVMDSLGRMRRLARSRIRFGYRSSSLAKYIILSASFRLSRNKRTEIKNRMRRYVRHRLATQGKAWRCAGCVFKNPAGQSAGRLIDLAGLKGFKVGGAEVSNRHANFIINKGGASAHDVLRLMRLIRKRVESRFGIELEPEVKIWQN